jgi:hypothetical protein
MVRSKRDPFSSFEAAHHISIRPNVLIGYPRKLQEKRDEPLLASRDPHAIYLIEESERDMTEQDSEMHAPFFGCDSV